MTTTEAAGLDSPAEREALITAIRGRLIREHANGPVVRLAVDDAAFLIDAQEDGVHGLPEQYECDAFLAWETLTRCFPVSIGARLRWPAAAPDAEATVTGFADSWRQLLADDAANYGDAPETPKNRQAERETMRRIDGLDRVAADLVAATKTARGLVLESLGTLHTVGWPHAEGDEGQAIPIESD